MTQSPDLFDFFLIQEQLHASKRLTSPISQDAGPFACYLNPDDSAHYENYAIPIGPQPESVPKGIARLVALFKNHQRQPRLEYIEACAPLLERALHRQGFETESRTVLMICTPGSLVRPAAMPGIRLELLTRDHPLEDFRQVKTIEKRSFGQPDAPAGTLEEAEEARRRYGRMPRVVARMDGKIVSTGVLTFAHNGIAEAAGIATLPTYRRRGLAGAVIARLADLGFTEGLQALFLTAADEAAGRVYTRAGFFTSGTHQINISLSGSANTWLSSA